MLAHQGLHVCDKALRIVGEVSTVSATWGRKHAVVDELDRASESIVLNVAEGAGLNSRSSKVRALEYALGSALESAACLDIASIKSLLSQPDAYRIKQSLHEVVCMLVGLRKSWQTWQAQEGSANYRVSELTLAGSTLFNHEKLEVYRAALELTRWLTALLGPHEPSSRAHRQLDVSFTSIALNIAEGDGRYAELDHHHFLTLARTSAVKASAHLDLALHRNLIAREEAMQAMVITEQVVSMLRQM